MHVFVKMSYMH